MPDQILLFTDLFLKVPLRSLGEQKDQYRLSIESKVDNPLATIESFNRQFQLGEKGRGRSSGDGKRKSEIPCSMWSTFRPKYMNLLKVDPQHCFILTPNSTAWVKSKGQCVYPSSAV